MKAGGSSPLAFFVCLHQFREVGDITVVVLELDVDVCDRGFSGEEADDSPAWKV